MMTIIIRVAAGLRPSLQPVSDEWPGEAQQMVALMKRCWDQDPKKRPCFLGVLPGFAGQGVDGARKGDSWAPSPLLRAMQTQLKHRGLKRFLQQNLPPGAGRMALELGELRSGS